MLDHESSLELNCLVSKAMLVCCDNVSVVYLTGSLVQNQRIKHIEVDIHFVREKVSWSQHIHLEPSTTTL